jgi:hypothetical protein
MYGARVYEAKDIESGDGELRIQVDAKDFLHLKPTTKIDILRDVRGTVRKRRPRKQVD